MVSGPKEQGDVGPAKVTISGFDPSSTYDFVILAVRYNGSADARASEYTVTGATVSETKTIWTGLKTFDGVENFDGYSVSYTAVKPDSSGNIVVSIVGKDTGKAADGHISALTISKTAN